MNEPFIVHPVKQLCGLVGRMIIHHNDIELEISLLSQRTVHSIQNSLLAVVDRNHHRSLDIKILFVEVWTAIERRIDLGTDLSQMGRSCMLHLYLHLAVTGVHIVELLHTRGPQVGFLFGIQTLVDMEQLTLTTQKQAQGIESGKLIIVLTRLHGEGMQQRGLKQPQAAEIEVIADAASEIVDHGMFLIDDLAVDLFLGDIVRIDHRRVRVAGHTEHTVERPLSQHHLHGLRQQQHIVGLRILRHLHQGVATHQPTFQLSDILHGLAIAQLRDDFLSNTLVHSRQETIYLFSHDSSYAWIL